MMTNRSFAQESILDGPCVATALEINLCFDPVALYALQLELGY